MAARDVIYIMATVFALGIGFLIIHYSLNIVLDRLIATPALNETVGVSEAFQASKNVTNKLDYIVFIVFIALVIALMITSWFIGGYPIFMIVYFIAIVLGVFVSIVLSNVYQTIAAKPQFIATVASHFPITNHLLNYLPLYMIVVGFIGIIIMFGKPYVQNG